MLCNIACNRRALSVVSISLNAKLYVVRACCTKCEHAFRTTFTATSRRLSGCVGSAVGCNGCYA